MSEIRRIVFDRKGYLVERKENERDEKSQVEEKSSRDDLEDLFYRYLERHHSKSSREVYIKTIRRFFDWLEDSGEQINQLTRVVLQEYCSSLKRKYTSSYYNNTLSILRTFFRVISSTYPKFYPFYEASDYWYDFVKIQKMPDPRYLSDAEQLKVRKEAELTGRKECVALVEILMSCGLRINEAVSLKIGQIEIGPQHGRITVLGKGNKERIVPVPPLRRRNILEQIENLPKPVNKEDWLFPSPQNPGKPISVRTARYWIKQIGKRAELPNLKPHDLRHTFAQKFLSKQGGTLPEVSQLLGHSSIQTTMIYSRTTISDIEKKMEGM